MPDANPAEQHLAYMRQLSGVPEPKADAAPVSVSRRDNTTSGAEPVVGSGTAAPLVEALNRGDRRPRQ